MVDGNEASPNPGNEIVVHRVGGGSLRNLMLSPIDRSQDPPGISVLLGGNPSMAAEQMRQAFPRSKKWQLTAEIVGTTTVGEIRAAGFDVIFDPTTRFPNHARLIHSLGEAGFSTENLTVLSQAFRETTGGQP